MTRRILLCAYAALLLGCAAPAAMPPSPAPAAPSPAPTDAACTDAACCVPTTPDLCPSPLPGPTAAATASPLPATALPAPTAAACTDAACCVPTTPDPCPSPLPATAMPAPTIAPSNAPATMVPTAAPAPVPATAVALADLTVVGYIGHKVAEGETLAQIAQLRGSDPALIQQYNRLAGEPKVGRSLIVPQLAGRPRAAEPEALINVRRGFADQPWVALTLDAGAGSAPTQRMLDALRERGVTITFFLTGTWIRENPDLVRQIVADGHEIANHTLTHRDLTRLPDAAIQAELLDTEQALAEQAPQVVMRPFFRPPYGAYDERVLKQVQQLGYMSIYWTLDSLDSVGQPKTPEFLLERVTAALPPEDLRGAIILAHCGSEPTADALPLILDRFKAMGFEVRKLSDVLQ